MPCAQYYSPAHLQFFKLGAKFVGSSKVKTQEKSKYHTNYLVVTFRDKTEKDNDLKAMILPGLRGQSREEPSETDQFKYLLDKRKS